MLGIVPLPGTPPGASYNPDSRSETLTLTDYRQMAQTAQDKALANALGKAGLRQIYQRSFSGAINGAYASVFLFRDEAGATTAFRLLQKSLSRPGSVDQRVTAVDADALGAEAWGARVKGASSDAGILLWRHGNVVVVADMTCDDTCEFDVNEAVRAFADEIDELIKQTASS